MVSTLCLVERPLRTWHHSHWTILNVDTKKERIKESERPNASTETLTTTAAMDAMTSRWIAVAHGGGPGGFRGDRRGSSDRPDDRGRGHIIMGLDVQALVDRLSRRGSDVHRELNMSRDEHKSVYQSGKAVTAIISNLARRRDLRLANAVWGWVDTTDIQKNTFHYNSMISVCEKVRDHKLALQLLDEMGAKGVVKNEVTFSSAISACEKSGQWRIAISLLDQMKREGAGQTAIAYNAAISACEKGLVMPKALEIFEQMKREGIKPTVVTYSALISAAEKSGQWKLALEILEEMKAAGHGANVIAYSAAISALSKGQMWEKAWEIFCELEASGGKPSIVTYNATMTALEKGLQWQKALDLFDTMKMKNMPVTVVSYGSAISACEKGLQYRQTLAYLDEMTEMGIKKNVIIFGAAMSCMEKSCRADIAFQLMDRMKLEGVAPNVHIYNSAISACARCSLWEKGYELFQEMERVGVARDVVTYNAVLDAVSSQIELGRRLFKEGVEKGFYSRVSRLGTQWLELDLHFLSLGGGEIALGWWFEECLVPYLINTSKLEAVQSISIVTGYGKTRTRGSRLNDDGMRLRVRAMLKYMNIIESPQPNKGRIHVNKSELVKEVNRNGGKIIFDIHGYNKFKEEETTANKFPDVPQSVRPRFRPARHGEGPPGTLIREGGAPETVPPVSGYAPDRDARRGGSAPTHADAYQVERRESRRSPYPGDGREQQRDWHQNQWGDQAQIGRSGGRNVDDRRGYGGGHGHYGDDRHHQRDWDKDARGAYGNHHDHRNSYDDGAGKDSYYGGQAARGHPPENAMNDRRGGYHEWDNRAGADRDRRPNQYDREAFEHYGDRERGRGQEARYGGKNDSSYYGGDRRRAHDSHYGQGAPSHYEGNNQNENYDRRYPSGGPGGYNDNSHYGHPDERSAKRQRQGYPSDYDAEGSNYYGQRGGAPRAGGNEGYSDPYGRQQGAPADRGSFGKGNDDQKPAANRGYNIEPSYSKRKRSSESI
eukprot:CAMPEP_0176011082 /NCGR_PEP_ID=MMETSP0120_2-20121206/5102_1 /TAXON_ID=160619 /ORGANISM="Kryptoperidinium foliaceum, Strain CCMP 1326" /LENGTH=999 /DNA_ID=CAMNT_0017343937 /DNA_START=176 /DNA_END=3175 /DNA_ORIENTATION=-